jgi:hypothetical protein
MWLGMMFELFADLRRWRSDTKLNEYCIDRVYRSAKGEIIHKMTRSDEI